MQPTTVAQPAHATLAWLTALASVLCHTLCCALLCCAQDDDERDVLREIISNSKLSEHFLALARDLDVMEPKVPEEVYKTHLTGACRRLGPPFVACLLSSCFFRPSNIALDGVSVSF